MLAVEESGGKVFGGGLSGLPVVQEKFLEPFGWMGADALEDVTEVTERVDLEPLAGREKGGQDGGGFPTVIAPEEETVPPPDSDPLQAASARLLSLSRSPSSQQRVRVFQFSMIDHIRRACDTNLAAAILR